MLRPPCSPLAAKAGIAMAAIIKAMTIAAVNTKSMRLIKRNLLPQRSGTKENPATLHNGRILAIDDEFAMNARRISENAVKAKFSIAPARSPKRCVRKSCGCAHPIYGPQTFVCGRSTSTNTHIHPPLLQALPGRGFRAPARYNRPEGPPLSISPFAAVLSCG